MSQWLIEPIRWTGDYKTTLLSQDGTPELPPILTLDQIIQKSSSFPIQFPIHTPRCCQLQEKTTKQILERNIHSAYPVLHEYSLYLCCLFLHYQRNLGLRREFYKDMSLLELVDRLLNKRAVMFLEAADHYQLLTGRTGSGNWESVGTKEEKEPLVLESCLSYDEIKLSALLSVSSYSYFINDGDRYNRGRFESDRSKVEEEGVVVGVIGARLEKPKVMEEREIVKTREQNIEKYGYGVNCVSLQNEFLKFYGDTCGTYEELEVQMKASKERYVDLGAGKFFDKLMFEKRIAISIDTLLLEANDRAKRESKMAYIHVVGLGLGVWKLYQGQNKLFMDTFARRLELLSNTLKNVSDVRFAYIRETAAGNYKNGDKIGEIKLHMVDRNPQEKLTGEDQGKLLVVSYPWDGNALPGNEFWGGSLSGSGDPATACSTQVAELHNPHINARVCGGNLMVATSRGLLTFQEYQCLHRDD